MYPCAASPTLIPQAAVHFLHLIWQVTGHEAFRQGHISLQTDCTSHWQSG